MMESLAKIIQFNDPKNTQTSARQALKNYDDDFSRYMHVPAHVFARIGSTTPEAVTWECPIHGVIQPRRVRQGYIRRECLCETELRYYLQEVEYREKEQSAQEQAKREREEQEASTSACYTWLGEEYSDLGWEEKTFESYKPATIPLRKAHSRMRGFIDHLPNCIILSGPCGTGKTHLACALLNAKRAQGKPGLFTSGMNLFNALQALDDDFQSKQRILTKMHKTWLLVVDDPEYGITEFRQNTFKEIFTKRCGRGLPTIITTNINVKHDATELADVLGAAAASRLNAGLELIHMPGEDYRKNLAE